MKNSKHPHKEGSNPRSEHLLSRTSFLSRKRPEGFAIHPPVIALSEDVIDLTESDNGEVIVAQNKNTALSDSEIGLTELPTAQSTEAPPQQSPRSPSPETVPLVLVRDDEPLSPTEIKSLTTTYFTHDALGLPLFHSELLSNAPDEFELFMKGTMGMLSRTSKPGYVFFNMITQFDNRGVSLLANAVKHAPYENLLLLLTEAEKQKNNGNISQDEYIQFLTTAKKSEENEDYAIIDYAVFHENPKLEICKGEPKMDETNTYGDQEKYIITETNLYHYHPVTNTLKKFWIFDSNLSSLRTLFPESTTLDLSALHVLFDITGHRRFPHLAKNLELLLFYMEKTLEKDQLGNALLYVNVDTQRTVLLGATLPGQSLLMKTLLTHLYRLVEKEVISRDDYIGMLNYPCYGEFSVLMMMTIFAALEPLKIFTKELAGSLTEKEYADLLTHANQHNYTALHCFLQNRKSFVALGKSLSSLQHYLAEIERISAHVDTNRLHLIGDDRLTALLTALTSKNEGLASAYLTHLDNTISAQKLNQGSRLDLLVGKLDRSPPRQAMERSFEIVHQFISLLEKHLSEQEYYFILHTKDYSPDGMVITEGNEHSLATRNNLDCLVIADASNPDAEEINLFLREARRVARGRILAENPPSPQSPLATSEDDAPPSPKRRRELPPLRQGGLDESPPVRPFFNHNSPRPDEHPPATSNIDSKP